MAVAPARTWLGLVGDTLKWPPALLIISGLFFLALGVATTLGTKDYSIAAESTWRAVSAGAGFVLILAGIVLYWRESRPIPAEPDRPGPYAHGRFPITIEGPKTEEPDKRIKVIHDRQEVTVKGSGKPLDRRYDYKLMLMHTGEKHVSPRFAPIDKAGTARGGVVRWETKVRLPELERIVGNEEWRLAFYYVGPNAQRLAEHHRAVCEYFAPNGKPKRWPQIDNPSNEFVQCSEVLVLRFRPASIPAAAS